MQATERADSFALPRAGKNGDDRNHHQQLHQREA